MITVYGVKFKENGKVEYYLPGEYEIKVGDKVICETLVGIQYGEVVQERQLDEEKQNSEIVETTANSENEENKELKTIIRMADEDDYKKMLENKNKAKLAFNNTLEIVKKYDLDMKLLDAEYSLDLQKLLFTFSAEDRVDFRELVKELAQIFKVRIELRQVGIRDEVKLIGGLGPCGRIACCNLFLSDYGKVGIKMAKQQCLSLSPTKINGICGKIMCCIGYENDTYVQNAASLPKINQKVKTRDGNGVVMYLNILEKKVTVKLFGDDERLQEYSAEEIKVYD